jgi:hypothetical protein
VQDLYCSLNNRGRPDPGRRLWRTFWTAAQARTIARLFSRYVICKELDVFTLWFCWTDRSAINAGGLYTNKELPIEAVIASQHSFVVNVFFGHRPTIAPFQAFTSHFRTSSLDLVFARFTSRFQGVAQKKQSLFGTN